MRFSRISFALRFTWLALKIKKRKDIEQVIREVALGRVDAGNPLRILTIRVEKDAQEAGVSPAC